MKTYRHKDNNGNYIKSIYPKATEGEEIIANGIIGLIILGVFFYILFNI